MFVEFETIAKKQPDRLAICGVERLCYSQLAQRADRIARAAWQAGLRPGGRAALLMDRSADAIAAMLAIRQIGAAYVPIEPGLPDAAREALLADAGPALLLSHREFASTRPALRLDQPLPDAPAFDRPRQDPDSPAYVMYTSGSTGTPKGVVVPCRGVLRLVLGADYVTLSPDDVVLHAAPLGFDASTLEIWGPLLNGGAIAILPDAVPSLDTIGDTIARHGVTIAWLTSGLFHAMVEHRVSALAPLRQLLAGGDVLSPTHVARALAALPDTTIINGYGPTENTTFTCCYRIPRDHPADATVPIGRPIAGTDVVILDEDGQPVPQGEQGELCAGGAGVALGYLNRPDLTARAFRPGPDGRVLYHTGDRARVRADGIVEFGGRADRQVKIRGKRVALDEMEGELRRDPAVEDAAILMQDGRAVAYVTGKVDAPALRQALLARLPDHMVPATITVLAAMPLTTNGKLDRKKLANPVGWISENVIHHVPAATTTQARITAIWCKILGRADLPHDVNLFDGGANSMDLVRAHAAMADAGLNVALTDLFAYPSIASLAAHLDGATSTAAPRAAASNDGIAIIGMAGRLPGAENLATFWQNLCDGVESIRRFGLDELQDAYSPAMRAHPAFVPARPILDGIDQFDPAFFHMTKRDAELTDPQQRVFMEIAWEALESAAYDPAKYTGRIGVFAGSSPNSYLLRNVLADRDAVLRYTSDYQTGSYSTLLGAGADFLATRIAYKLDLRGPAITVSTACSTSLVAIAQGCAVLRAGQADMVLAGGVSITLPQHRGYLHEPGSLASADGHVRPFDAQASGTVFGSGAGVVLLKRLADAIADGDHIHAVIAGIATNNDGAGKVGFTAPSVGGQIACIADAQAQAAFPPATIGYVEAHGTATPLGDPIEFAALRETFGADGACVLGSVKGNVGHLDAAAGVTGLIKAALTIEHATIPGTLHFRTPNPAMALAGSPFTITARTQPWSGPTPRRAAVSAFGVGGTNAHAVLDQAPHASVTPDTRPNQILVLSARSAAALAEARLRLANHLAANPAQSLPDIAHTLQTGRRRFAHRLALACTSHADAIAALQDGRAATGSRPGDGGVAFLFPGQGAQYAGMGRALFEDEPVFRAAVDRCADILQPLLGLDLRDILYGDAAQDALVGTGLAQPALFTIGYATATLWMSWGLSPAAMLGHSVGEFVAACLAGVFTLHDALTLIAERGRLMASMPGGVMLAIRLPEADLLPLLGETMDLAANNAPSLSVAAGSYEAAAALEAVLTARGVMYRRLHTSHAFHSRMMDGAVQGLREAASRIVLSPPSLPFISGVTGDWITAEQATSPDYWAGHCRAPVRFAAGLDTLLTRTPAALLECGPGRTLTTLALQGAARGGAVAVVPSLPDAGRERDEHATTADAIAQLTAAGVEPDWRRLHGPGRRRVPLPTTPWDRVRCWIDEPELTKPRVLETAPTMDHAAPVATDDTLPELFALFEELSGDKLTGADPAANFLQLGFDSLFLGQVAQQVRSKFSVPVTFRQLMGDLSSFGALAKHVAAGRPARAPAPKAAPTAVMPAMTAPPVAAPAGPAPEGAASLMQQQVAAMSALFAQQLAAFGSAPASASASASAPVSAPAPQPAPAAMPVPENTARFDAFKVVAAGTGGLTPSQRAHVEALVAATVARTPTSKRMTAEARKRLADPRAAAGFRPDWKEMTYPLVAVRSAGPLIWDADGNEYVDLVNGFGQTAYGHAPPFVTEAVRRQLDRGFEIGPQAELAGHVAARFCAMTGNERMTFCNTGSEAVMAAMRIARTVTGRTRIATFAGSYHGQFDEVLVKAAPKGTRPVAPGIPLDSVGNNIVLEYGADASLAWIRAHADELAAVMFEPVQSRHPGVQPRAFAHELRAITERAGICLIFDEVVTGFRTHPGGMQAIYGIRADLATYGKVVGGGMPVGILAGRASYMDALDGGDWNYGDDSTPEAAVTFFAGTFVRHPLALAALDAVLNHIETSGPALQEGIGGRTVALAARLNDALAARHLPRCIEHYASWFYFKLPDPLATLLYPNMRLRGVHIQEGFPCFLTTTHGPAEIDRIYNAFVESLDALQAAGILLPAGAPAPVAAIATTPTEAPLTGAQMEIWLASQLGDAASCAFNEGISLHMRGTLDVAALQTSITRVFARHDALRARFTPTGDRMIIGPFAAPDLPITEQPLDTVLADEAKTPFDLVTGPPVRLRLVRLAADHHVLVLTAHHIICDGWSINTLLSELAEPGALPPALSFATYAARQTGLRSNADLAWWTSHFATVPAALDLPSDRPRPALRSFEGGTRRMVIDAPALGRIRAAGAASGCTLFATLLAAVSVMAGRLANRSDVVIAVPAAAQSQLEEEVLVGHCANLLPLRANWTDQTRFSDHLAAMRLEVLDAYEHQDCTLGTIIQALNLPRDISRLPLTDVQFNLEKLADGMAMPGLTLSCAANPKAFVNFDLFFNAVESKDGLAVDCDYNADLFDPQTVDRWLGHLRTVLEAIAANPAQPIGDIALLSHSERHALLHGLNDTAAPLPTGPVHKLIERRAARTPDAIAARFGEVTLSYGELDAQANRMARLLLTYAAPGDRVAVMLDRTPHMLAVLLGAWKAGMAYVPLDPSHPPARLGHIMADAGAAVLVTDGTGPELAGPVLDLRLAQDEIAAQAATPPGAESTVAYVIYTSGSTGLPKGVAIGHKALGNLLLSMGREPGIAASDIWLAVTTISFDIAGLELWGPLVAGAQVVVASRADAADGHRLRDLLQSSKATIMQATPASWRLLLETGWTPGSLRMLCGGEALPRTLADRLLASGEGAELWNMYGPTETTIWSAVERVGEGPITVGHPIANTVLYVLDDADRLVPVGVPGHLHIGGAGLAEGYRNKPEMTAERFIADPFTPGARLYRTGDSARKLPDGRVQVLGRIDSQIKLRGYRMEAGEVEHALTTQCGLAEAAVAVREGPGGEPRLLAWVVLRPGEQLDERHIRSTLRAHLPEYMVPALFVTIGRLPLTPNGKIDRNAMPDPAPAAATTAELPQTALERTVAEIWSAVLHRPVGRTDDLLAMGADSIQLFQITARANAAGLSLLARHLLQHRTVAAVAAALGDTATPDVPDVPSLRQFRRDRKMAVGD